MSHSTDLTIPASMPGELASIVETILLGLLPRSRRVYLCDLKKFFAWMEERGVSLPALSHLEMVEYQAWLLAQHERPTAARCISVARSLLTEYSAVTGTPNPAARLKPIRTANESPHIALTKAQARELLSAIDRSTVIGKRNYAIVKLLVRTGLRRSECAALNIGDISREQGHYIATIRHGKGDKRRKVKLPVDVFRAIQEYIEAAYRTNADPDAPLFVQIGKGSRVREERISDKVIERLVSDLAERIGEPGLKPHGLRATFITLALEGGASLHQTQYAAGHADPRTTERYQKRKMNLDDNAVDYVRIDA